METRLFNADLGCERPADPEPLSHAREARDPHTADHCILSMERRRRRGTGVPACTQLPGHAFSSRTYIRTPILMITYTATIRGQVRNAQEHNQGPDNDNESDETTNQRALLLRHKALCFAYALWIGIDEPLLPVWELRRAGRVLRVEAVLLEALRAGGGARRDRAGLESRAVDGGALEALPPFRIGCVAVGREAPDSICMRLVEE